LLLYIHTSTFVHESPIVPLYGLKNCIVKTKAQYLVIKERLSITMALTVYPLALTL